MKKLGSMALILLLTMMVFNKINAILDFIAYHDGIHRLRQQGWRRG